MSPKELSKTINPYAEMLVGLDKTVCHRESLLPHPKAQIKQALFEVAKTIQEEKALEDLGMMVAYLSLFVSDTEMDQGTYQSLKKLITKRMLASFTEFTEYVETHIGS